MRFRGNHKKKVYKPDGYKTGFFEICFPHNILRLGTIFVHEYILPVKKNSDWPFHKKFCRGILPGPYDEWPTLAIFNKE